MFWTAWTSSLLSHPPPPPPFPQTLSLLLVIMGCACCKQKKSAKAVVTSSAAAGVGDLSPSNLDGGLSTALTQGRYCPDPTQAIPDFNKGFSSSAIFSNTNTHQRPGVITSRNGSITLTPDSGDVTCWAEL